MPTTNNQWAHSAINTGLWEGCRSLDHPPRQKKAALYALPACPNKRSQRQQISQQRSIGIRVVKAKAARLH